MGPIDILIFDRLAAAQGVVLPDVGSLSVERDAAKFVSRSKVVPPQNRVVFSRESKEGFDSVIDLIMAADDVKRPEATKKYKEWLESARQEEGHIEIAGVGVLKNGFFYTSAILHDTLNPAGDAPVALKKRRSPWRTLLIVLLSLVAAAGIALLVLRALDVRLCDVLHCKTHSGLNAGENGENIVAITVPLENEDRSAEDLIQQGLEQYAAQSASAKAAPVFYVSAGVFRNEDNADRLIANDRLMVGSDAYVKIPYKGMTMVTVFSSPSINAAYNRYLELLYLDTDLWVYEKK